MVWWRLISYVQDGPLGTLACLDGYMNIALENTEEYVEGRLKNTYGDTFIRGNNGKHDANVTNIDN